MLLDDVLLTFFDALEPIRDVHPVSELVRFRLDEIKLGGIGKPTPDQGRGLQRPGSLPEAWRDESPELSIGGEARRDRSHVLRCDRLDEPLTNRLSHGRECTGVATLRTDFATVCC